MIITGIEIKDALNEYFIKLYHDQDKENEESNYWNKEINYSHIDVTAMYTLESKPTHYDVKYTHIYDNEKQVTVKGILGIKYVRMTESDCSLYTLDRLSIDTIIGLNLNIRASYQLMIILEKLIHDIYQDNKTICSYYY